MTGLVPVIHVGVAPEGLGWAGNWNRVDGRDKPHMRNSNVDNSITREL